MASENVLTLTDQNFRETLEGGSPVLVDFYAEWCGPCKRMAPDVEALAGELKGKLTVGKLDIDHNQETAMKYGITAVPTLILFKDGRVLDQQMGQVPKSTLKTFVSKALTA
ncbi:MAG: thioredoxin [Acidobacteriota bacterium]